MKTRRGDVVLVLFPNSDLRTAKRRPALVVQRDNLGSGLEQTIVAMISSNLARRGHPSRVFYHGNLTRRKGGRSAARLGRDDTSKPQRNVTLLPVNLIDPSSARAIISDCEDYEMPEMQLLTLLDRIRRRSN
jgi:hypothetical protein